MRVDDALLKRLCRARDQLERLDDDAPTLEVIAHELRTTPWKLIRQFEALFGRTPGQHRIHARLDHAKQLLALGSLPITEVCLEAGFSSLGSFSSAFARRVGQSPSAYRRRIHAVPRPPIEIVAPGCLNLLGLLPAAAFCNFGEAPPSPAPL